MRSDKRVPIKDEGNLNSKPIRARLLVLDRSPGERSPVTFDLAFLSISVEKVIE